MINLVYMCKRREICSFGFRLWGFACLQTAFV